MSVDSLNSQYPNEHCSQKGREPSSPLYRPVHSLSTASVFICGPPPPPCTPLVDPPLPCASLGTPSAALHVTVDHLCCSARRRRHLRTPSAAQHLRTSRYHLRTPSATSYVPHLLQPEDHVRHLQTASAAACGTLLLPCPSTAEPPPPCALLRTPSTTLHTAATGIPPPLCGTCIPPAAACGPPLPPPTYPVCCSMRTESAACKLPPPPPADPFCCPAHHLRNLRCPPCPITPPFFAHHLWTLRQPATA